MKVASAPTGRKIVQELEREMEYFVEPEEAFTRDDIE